MLKSNRSYVTIQQQNERLCNLRFHTVFPLSFNAKLINLDDNLNQKTIFIELEENQCLLLRSVNFEIFFRCHQIDQNTNKFFVRISALAS
jgi:hypothetical protein